MVRDGTRVDAWSGKDPWDREGIRCFLRRCVVFVVYVPS